MQPLPREPFVGTADSTIVSILTDMLVDFSDSPTYCDQYGAFFILIHSIEAELCSDFGLEA